MGDITYAGEEGMDVVVVHDAILTRPCRCPRLHRNRTRAVTGRWSPNCPVHGTNSDWFRILDSKPFGYSPE
jgi:hypothetical protein